MTIKLLLKRFKLVFARLLILIHNNFITDNKFQINSNLIGFYNCVK